MTTTTSLGRTTTTPTTTLNQPPAQAPTTKELDAQKELAIRLVDKDQIETNGKLDPSLSKLFDRANIDVRSSPQLMNEVDSIRRSLHNSEGRKKDAINSATDDMFGALQNEWNEQAIDKMPLASRLFSGILDPFASWKSSQQVDWGKERDRFGIAPAGGFKPTDQTVQGCAKILLDSKNVSFWSELSSGSDRQALEQIAKTGKSYVPATGGTVTPNLDMMQALVDMSKAGPIQINALTGGEHSEGSNHYAGNAVDLSIYAGDPAKIEAIANQHGGIRNYETDHIHLDF